MPLRIECGLGLNARLKFRVVFPVTLLIRFKHVEIYFGISWSNEKTVDRVTIFKELTNRRWYFNVQFTVKCKVRFLYILYISLHPLFQLLCEPLIFPFSHVSNNYTRIKGAGAGADAKVSNCLLSIVQKSHVCVLGSLKKKEIHLFPVNLNEYKSKCSSMLLNIHSQSWVSRWWLPISISIWHGVERHSAPNYWITSSTVLYHGSSIKLSPHHILVFLYRTVVLD